MGAPDPSADVWHFGPYISFCCQGRIVDIPNDVVRLHLDGDRLTCPQCGASSDWWTELLKATKGVMTMPLAVVGAHQTIFQLELKKGEATELDFSAAGVPEDARILRVIYTTIGEGDTKPLFPLQQLTSQPEPPWIPRKFPVHPLAFPDSAEASRVNVLVAWLPTEETSTVRSQLITAFDEYARGSQGPPDFDDCIIPANTAVEVALGTLLAQRLGQDVSADNLRDFLDEAATYGHQLNVLLPVLAKTVGAPELPSEIRGALNRLKSLRNQLAHQGVTKQPVTRDEAAASVCAAFFGVGYLQLVEPLFLSH